MHILEKSAFKIFRLFVSYKNLDEAINVIVRLYYKYIKSIVVKIGNLY